MFLTNQSLGLRDKYKQYLSIVWWLSNLFSDSDVPALYYRAAENIFCKSFNADNLSRGDIAIDAIHWGVWIWLKTFLYDNWRTFQKVAEFNALSSSIVWLGDTEVINQISRLRNERLEFAEHTYKTNNLIYHCVLRDKWKFLIYEEPMHYVNIWKITNIKRKKNSIAFNDWINEYSFLLSKNTLTKRFTTDSILCEFDVNILNNPYDYLLWLLNEVKDEIEQSKKILWTVFLPLYATSWKSFDKSWLNQWNAGWRKRDINEVYIPIPAKVHNIFPNFFPGKDDKFNLKLPDWEIISAKVCQSWRKALMSDPNKKLWQWLLREILWLKEWKVLTYQKLLNIWIDAVRIDKISEGNYDINFSEIWKYENFVSNHS